MDQRLSDKLNRWHDTIEQVCVAEKLSLTLEANEKPLWGKLFLSATGRNVAEKEAEVYSHPDWIALTQGSAEAKAEANNSKRLLELRQAAFQASYLQCKNEADAIQKFPKSVT